MTTRQSVAVVGGGLMGTGIAIVFAAAGHSVTLFDPSSDVRDALPSRLRADLNSLEIDLSVSANIKISESLALAVAGIDYVTEAVPEKLDLKRRVFAELEQCAPPAAILASNTSVIPIHRITEGLPTAHRMIGTHWWNPATLVPLVEVVQARTTSDTTVAVTMALLSSIGKRPAHILKDVAGFVANRLQHALWREAISMVAEGICDAETLDDCVKNSFGRRLAVLGPLENADLVGLDLTLDIHNVIMPELSAVKVPHPYLESKVASEQLGFKTGAGFRSWSDVQIAAVRERLANHLRAAQRTDPMSCR